MEINECLITWREQREGEPERIFKRGAGPGTCGAVNSQQILRRARHHAQHPLKSLLYGGCYVQSSVRSLLCARNCAGCSEITSLPVASLEVMVKAMAQMSSQRKGNRNRGMEWSGVDTPKYWWGVLRNEDDPVLLMSYLALLVVFMTIPFKELLRCASV